MQTIVGAAVTLAISALIVAVLWRAYRAGVAAEKAAQAERDDRTEDMIRDKRDELSRTDEDDLEQRLRRWQ